MNFWKIFKNGIFKENPALVLLLGMCPTLATTTSLTNAIGMGLSATFVLVGSNVAIAALRKHIPQKIRIAAYIVIIAGFVTIIDLLLKAYAPALAASLGIFIPLITVNCIILARAEAFASKNTVLASAIDGVGMGAGFTLAICVIAFIRELLGNGTVLGVHIFSTAFKPAIIMILPPGGFLVLGLLLGTINYIVLRRPPKRDKKKIRSVKRFNPERLKYKLES